MVDPFVFEVQLAQHHKIVFKLLCQAARPHRTMRTHGQHRMVRGGWDGVCTVNETTKQALQGQREPCSPPSSVRLVRCDSSSPRAGHSSSPGSLSSLLERQSCSKKSPAAGDGWETCRGIIIGEDPLECEFRHACRASGFREGRRVAAGSRESDALLCAGFAAGIGPPDPRWDGTAGPAERERGWRRCGGRRVGTVGPAAGCCQVLNPGSF